MQDLDGPLTDLLPLRFDGGLKLEMYDTECVRCGRLIDASHWNVHVQWLASTSACLITPNARCPCCTFLQQRSIRIRAQKSGWACVDRKIDGEWVTTVVGNVNWTDRLRKMLGV